tara:strand:- start:128 stop:625 length:498 start_codon:yes stop_codon:yes gene_type:complete
MENFNLKKYIAESKLLKEDSSQGDMYGLGPAYQALDSGIQYYIDEFIKDINADIEAGTDKASITKYLNDLIKAIAALRDSVTFPSDLAENKLKENNYSRYEDTGLRIGATYDVKDSGDGEFRNDMEYLGYSRNERAHLFRGFTTPGSNEIDLMYIEKGDEDGNIR